MLCTKHIIVFSLENSFLICVYNTDQYSIFSNESRNEIKIHIKLYDCFIAQSLNNQAWLFIFSLINYFNCKLSINVFADVILPVYHKQWKPKLNGVWGWGVCKEESEILKVKFQDEQKYILSLHEVILYYVCTKHVRWLTIWPQTTVAGNIDGMK